MILVANEKLISHVSTIQRALGMIEGASCGVDSAVATTLIDAVEMIDIAIKEMTEDGET